MKNNMELLADLLPDFAESISKTLKEKYELRDFGLTVQNRFHRFSMVGYTAGDDFICADDDVFSECLIKFEAKLIPKSTKRAALKAKAAQLLKEAEAI